MDEDKTKPIVKKVRNSVDRTSRANSTAAGTTLEKVPVEEKEKKSARAEEAHRSANSETGQMKLDEWKMEKEKMREKALMTDRVIIEERMSEEVINLEYRNLLQRNIIGDWLRYQSEGSTLALKPRADVTSSPKQGSISGPTKMTCILQTF